MRILRFRMPAAGQVIHVGGLLLAMLAMLAATPAPGPVPANASRVTARVLGQKVWPPGSLKNVRPHVPDEQTWYSLHVEILTTASSGPTLSHLAELGSKLEVFSSKELPAGLVGQKIEATLKLTGDTDGSRWLVENFRKLPTP